MEQFKQVLFTLGRVFFGSAIGFAIATELNILDMSWTNYKPAIAAGISALLVAAFNALNPADPRYGLGAQEPQE
jgi:hypothetical protein